MATREAYQKRIESHLKSWKAKLDQLKARVDQTEAEVKTKYHEQIEILQGKREEVEKKLEELKVAGEGAWDNVKSGVEFAWNELRRTAKSTVSKIRFGNSGTNRDEEIRLIAYQLWQDEGCPHGRHLEHWFRAEAIWQERQLSKEPVELTAPKPKRTTKRKTVRKKPSGSRGRPKKKSLPPEQGS